MTLISSGDIIQSIHNHLCTPQYIVNTILQYFIDFIDPVMDSDHEIEFRDPFIDARNMPQSDTQINENINLPPMAGARPKSSRSKENSNVEFDQNKMNPEIIALLKSLSTPQNTCKRDFPPFDGSQNFDDYYQQALKAHHKISIRFDIPQTHYEIAP